MPAVVLEALEVDLQPAARRAELGEVLVHAGHAAAEEGGLLDEDHGAARLGGLEGCGHAGDPAPQDQDSLAVETF